MSRIESANNSLYLLGHMSVQTTERYPGRKQRVHNAVNDRIGLEAIEVCCSDSRPLQVPSEPMVMR